MKAPDGEPVRRGRCDALVATSIAALALCSIETVYAEAERWHHSLEYFGLSAALTLALSLAVGSVGAVLRIGAVPVLAAWCGLCLGFSRGWPEGVAALAVSALALALPWARSARPAVLGTCAALGLACAYLKCPGLAEHLGRKDDFQVESIGKGPAARVE